MMNKILIIEDEEAIAELEKDYLEISDFEVTIENDGEKGLKTALSEEFDLIILDLMLPGIDGYEICKQIRNQKISRSSWYRRRRMILIRSEVWDWVQMII